MSNSLLSTNEMAQAIANRPNRRLNYKEQSDEHKAESLSADIESKIMGLKQTAERERVDLNNLSEVRERTYQYMEACKQAGAFPSVQGLAVYAYGFTRQGLNRYLRLNSDTPTSIFIEMVKDSIADILVNQSLYKNCDSIQALFQLKNNHDFSDRVQIEPITTDPFGGQVDSQELAQRYSDLPED